MTTIHLPARTPNRTLLEGLHRELSAEIEEASAVVRLWSQPAGDGDDDVDAGTRAARREQDVAILSSIRGRLRQVERCLERTDAGEYGRCEVCGGSIPAARLGIFPSATTCVTCQKEHERRA